MRRALSLSLLLVALFPACANTAQPLRGTMDKTTTTVEVRWLDPQDVNEACQKAGATVAKGYRIAGCAQVYTDRCVIHASRPLAVDDDRTTTLGHELLHCLIGTFHE